MQPQQPRKIDLKAPATFCDVIDTQFFAQSRSERNALYPDAAQIEQCTIICRRSFARVAIFNSSLPDDLAQALWMSPESLLERGELLRVRGARHTVKLLWKSQPFVLKHYVEPTRRHALKQTVQRSRACATWTFTHRLADVGIATPRPVACIENRWGLLRRDSFLMYPYVEGRTLRSYFAAEAKQSTTLRNQLWQQLHELWERLSELRVSLGDAHVGNIVVCPTGQLWLIDLDKSRFHRGAGAAAVYQRLAWQKLLKSASKCSD
jgi:tRNA A-37 threonylcarbamoyl transferase component Bud32